MEANSADVPKPRSLTNAEWNEVQHASRKGWLHYVFGTSQFIWPLLALLLGTFAYQLFHTGGAVFAAFDEMRGSGLRTGFATLVVWIVIRRTIDWHGRRATGKAAGL